MPASPKSGATKFPTWDSLVAEAQSTVEGIETYQLPLGRVERMVGRKTVVEDDVVVEIPCPDGANYITIIQGQRVGDSPRILQAMIPDDTDRARVIAAMGGVPWPIVDVLTSKVLRHYYGLSIETEEKSGNSNGS